eukprot:scaffold46647_cov25-Prasinocladus_malaysianus.AAC.1
MKEPSIRWTTSPPPSGRPAPASQTAGRPLEDEAGVELFAYGSTIILMTIIVVSDGTATSK